jgi:hypothetical protein
MAYAVRQVNRNKTYVYIAENIYRSELKQSRQIREYVGTLDNEDNLTLGKNVSIPDSDTVRLLERAGIKYSPLRKHQKLRCKCGTKLIEGNCPLCSGAVKGVERIGAKHLFEELSSDLKLDRCLGKAFGKKRSDLFSLAFYRSVTGKALYLAAPWLNSAGVDGSFSSGTISRLLREIGADGTSREKLLSHWCKALGESPELICDITSISA